MKEKDEPMVVTCGRCGSKVKAKKHINKCKCGARIKILGFHG